MYFYLYEDSTNEWRWNLRAANHKIIADSAESYKNRQDALHAIGLIIRDATSASIYDKSKEAWL